MKKNDTFDAHVHTALSDAAPDQSPQTVCQAAKAAGVGHLAITDHDRLLPETLRLELARTFDLDLIPGCEFNASLTLSTGRPVTAHILGLWLPDTEPLHPLLNDVISANQSQDFAGYCKAMLSKLLAHGIDPSGCGVCDSFKMIQKLYPRSTHLGKNAVAHLLVETGHCASTGEAKDRYLSAFGQQLAYVSSAEFCCYAPLEKVMSAANLGVSVLCHLNYYQLSTSENEELIQRFKNLGGQALEVDYGFYTPEQQAQLMRYCKKYDLLAVASSDRHEANTPFKLGNPKWFHALFERCPSFYES